MVFKMMTYCGGAIKVTVKFAIGGGLKGKLSEVKVMVVLGSVLMVSLSLINCGIALNRPRNPLPVWP